MEVWPFVPQREFTESLEWLTDVLRNKGGEQRISLRPVPRQGHAFEYLMDAAQLARARSFSKGLGAGEFLVPAWEFRRYAGQVNVGASAVPAETDYAPWAVGDTAVVWGAEDRVETRTVTAVGSGEVELDLPLERGYAAAIVMPGRVSQFDQDLEASRRQGPLYRAQARFVTTQYVDLSAAAPSFPQYRGHDVMTDRTVLISDVSERYMRESERFDSSLGPLWRGAEFTYPVQTSQVGWSVDDQAGLWRLRGWLDTRRGKWKGFWVPSWDPDFVLAASALSTDTVLTVRDVGFRLLGKGDVMIQLANGTVINRRILSAQAGLTVGTERITLDSAPGTALTPSNVQLMTLLTFMRLDADRVEIRHRAGRGADLFVPTMEAPVP